MRTGALILALLVTTSMGGCAALEDRWNDLQEDLKVHPRFNDTVLLEDGMAFSITDILDPTTPPQQQEDVGASWTTTLDVPNGTRTMRVLFVVSFTDTPLNQDGQVRVFVDPPGANNTETEFFEASGAGGFDFRGPQAGNWTLGYDQGLGQGEVTFRVEAVVPVNATRTR